MKKTILLTLTLSMIGSLYSAERRPGTKTPDKINIILANQRVIVNNQRIIMEQLKHLEQLEKAATKRENKMVRVLALASGLTDDLNEMRLLLDKNKDGET